jgi:hypothetical protein
VLHFRVETAGYAQSSGLAEPTYVFTSPVSGRVTVTVDGRGNFVPALRVNGACAQSAIGDDHCMRWSSM